MILMSYTLGAGFSTGNLAANHDLDKAYRAKLKNVDFELTEDNVVLINNLEQQDTGRVENLEAYADRLMQPVVDAYNAKQRRQDRQVKGGYLEGYHYQNEHYTQGKEGKPEIWKEAVLSYGGHSNIGGEYFSKDTSRERKKEIYQEAINFYDRTIKEIQKQYPHMHIAYAVVHADEPNGSIHCHIGFTFIADYNQGLRKRICWSRGLEQDGIVQIKDATLAQEEGGFQLTRFYAQVRREIMNPMLHEIGYHIKQEEHGIPHDGNDRYKIDKDKAKEEAAKIVQEAEERAIKINMTADKLKDVASAKANDIVNKAEEVKASAVNEAALIKQEAQAESELIKQEAQKESEQIIENANERALEALSAAQSAEADKERAIEQKAEIEASAASFVEQAAAKHIELIKECNKTRAELEELKSELKELEKYQLTQSEIDRVNKDIKKAEESAQKKGMFWSGDLKVDVRLETLKGLMVHSAKFEKLDHLEEKIKLYERDVHRRETTTEQREKNVRDRELAVEAPEEVIQERINREVKKALDGQDNIFRNKAGLYDKAIQERDQFRNEIEEYHAIAKGLNIGQGISLQKVIDTVHRSRTPDVVNKVLEVCDYIKTGYGLVTDEIKRLAQQAKSIGHSISHSRGR